MAEYIEREAFLDYMKGTSRYFNVKFDIEIFLLPTLPRWCMGGGEATVFRILC